MSINVAVTGVGGGCGQSIIRALQMSSLDLKIFAVNYDTDGAGLYFSGVKPIVLGKPEKSFDDMIKFVQENHIDALIPGSDHDLAPLSLYPTVINALVQPFQLCQMSNDKALTVTGMYGLRSPVSAWGPVMDTDVEALGGYPLIVKPRFGMTSRGVQKVNDSEELDFYYRRTHRPIVQQYIDGDEYTCALYFDKSSQYRFGFQMKRELYAGTTYKAEVTDDPVVWEFMEKAGRLLSERYKASGPLNIQIRVQDGKAYLLEINARCSGSTAIRASFNYNEPEMLIRERILGEKIEKPQTSKGMALRYWEFLVK